jgi:uncharacterized protein YdhG (YjbR/CyaY superfamily)
MLPGPHGGRATRREEQTMAKPIRATPTVTGEVAKQIRREIREGTPDTPQRVKIISGADEAFRRHIEPILKKSR